MRKVLKIGIVGCGAIGSSLAKIIKNDFKGKAKVVCLFDIDKNKAFQLAQVLGYNNLVAKDLRSLIKKSHLVIEATHAHFSYAIARKTLLSGKDIMVMSIGGLLDKYENLSKLALRKNRHVYLPSGALCGIDGLKASREGKITMVRLTTTKPVFAFKGVEYVLQKFGNPENFKKETVLFSGSAEKAVKIFPQNINVAAVLSMAGIGAKNTCVRIIASPFIKRNIHEVEIYAQSGKLYTKTENIAHPDNPKTSFLAVLSAVATLRKVLEPIQIGT